MNNDRKEHDKLKHNFDLYYQTELLPLLQKHERTRYKYLTYFAILLVLGLIFYPLIVSYILVGDGTTDVGKILSFSGLIIVFCSAPLLKYKSEIKPEILPIFADFFGNFSYNFGRNIDENILRKSNIFKPFDAIKGDDFFSGTYENVFITLSEESHYKISATQKNVQRKKIFSGICIMLEMNKKFKGQTVGLADHGILNKFYQIKNLQKINLEDSKFEEYFEVYADDQVEARFLLTTAFMERLLTLRDLYKGRNIQFCFVDNKLILSIPAEHNMFEAQSFFCSNINKQKIDEVFEQFYTIFSIIKILKLNQHIGI